MSGFLPDLASWALRGGAGNDPNEDGTNNNGSSTAAPPEPALTEDEMRARRLARMMAAAPNVELDPEPMQTDSNDDSEKMQVDTSLDRNDKKDQPPKKETPLKESPKKEAVNVSSKKIEEESNPSPSDRKKKPRKESTQSDASRKLQRKKELFLRKILGISIQPGEATYEYVLVDNDEITVQTIAEILATRLSMSPSDLRSVSPSKRELIPYLAQSHKKAAEESKTLKQSKANTQELEELLDEIQRQVVSYAASSLMEPDLFELGKDGTTHLATCLINGTTDLSSSITFGVTGPSSSFYHCLCEELVLQDTQVFTRVIGETLSHLTTMLSKCTSILDGGSEGGLVVVSALTALCGHKKAALAVAQAPSFLLPPPDSPESQQRITPTAPTLPPGATSQQQRLFRIMRSINRGGGGYLKRSGPALDQETLLGLVLRLGCPRDDPAVTSAFGNILMQSVDSIEKTVHSQQRQLRIYQDACYQLIRCLITAEAESRSKVCREECYSYHCDFVFACDLHRSLCFCALGDAMDCRCASGKHACDGNAS